MATKIILLISFSGTRPVRSGRRSGAFSKLIAGSSGFGTTFANPAGARSAILYEGAQEMNLQHMIRIFLILIIAITASGVGAAQTADQVINVRIVPTTSVEERVANEAKEKQLREKLAADEATRIQATNPKALLSHARILFISSNTTYFEAVQLENALRKRTEIDTWQVAMVDDWQKRDVADTHIEIDRPFFTFTYTYKITDRKTGIVLATGKITAMDSNAAAPMLAERIVEEIRKARGEVKK